MNNSRQINFRANQQKLIGIMMFHIFRRAPQAGPQPLQPQAFPLALWEKIACSFIVCLF